MSIYTVETLFQHSEWALPQEQEQGMDFNGLSNLGAFSSFKDNKAGGLPAFKGFDGFDGIKDLKGFGNANQAGGASDLFNFNPAANQRALYNRSQFTLQQESTRYMETDTGYAYKHQSVSIEIIQERLEVSDINSPEALASKRVNDYFSPENTSERTFNMATSFFPAYAEQHGLEDNEANRQEYVNFVSGFIDKGFESAKAVLGDLPDEVNSAIQETIDLVHQKLAGFVNGETDGYYAKIVNALQEDFDKRDSNGDGLLTQEESGLDEEKYNRLNADGNEGVSLKEIADDINRLDTTKDLSPVLLESALKTTNDANALAEKAKSLLSNNNRITVEVLRINIVVTETIIQYSENPEKDAPSFAKFLDNDEQAQDAVNETPASIMDYLKQFKLDHVLPKLNDFPSLADILNKPFFDQQPDKLDFMFDNPNMLDYLQANPGSAQAFAEEST